MTVIGFRTQSELSHRQALADRQLNSRYHAQWQADEKQLQQVRQLQAAHQQLVHKDWQWAKRKYSRAYPPSVFLYR